MTKLLAIPGMPIFAIFTGFLIFMAIKIRQSDATHRTKIDQIVKREQDALLAPKNDVPEDLFLEVNKDLPFDEIVITETMKLPINRLKGEILELLERKMLIPNISNKNIELKEKFGIDTFEDIISYEQNYTKYIIALNSLAKVLINNSQLEVAEKFLLEAIKINSETSKTYIYLIDIYVKTNPSKLHLFIEEFKNKHQNSDEFYVSKVLEYYEHNKTQVLNN